MPVEICAVTSTRADYGILSPLLRKLEADHRFALTIAATGTHLLSEYGETVREITADGFTPVRIPIMQSDRSGEASTSYIMSEALRQFADHFDRNRYDLLLVLGDRFEINAICAAAVNMRIPIAHLHGGETSQGAIDECYRHAITKMSCLHFPCCEVYRKRIIQMGEQPENVFNVGALAVENILHTPMYPLEQLSNEVRLPLCSQPYAIVTFHPVTQENHTGMEQLKQLMQAMDEMPGMNYLITKSNADQGGQDINRAWDRYGETRENCAVVTSLGMRRYLSALRSSLMVIGNSSSGIIEAPICRVPTVNIGDRQKGRLSMDSILDCKPEKGDILRAMKIASQANIHSLIQRMACPYGDGHTSSRTIEIIAERTQKPLELKKVFYDM